MLLAVVRSHYGQQHIDNREKVYRAGNALADWLGLNSWVDIVAMQSPERVGDFARIVENAK